jgi:hypothetical protein
LDIANSSLVHNDSRKEAQNAKANMDFGFKKWLSAVSCGQLNSLDLAMQ